MNNKRKKVEAEAMIKSAGHTINAAVKMAGEKDANALLVHYLTFLLEKNGVQVAGTNIELEINSIIPLICGAIKSRGEK